MTGKGNFRFVFLALQVFPLISLSSQLNEWTYPTRQVLTSKTTECPCTFTVSAAHDAPPFDLLVLSRHPSSVSNASVLVRVANEYAHALPQFSRFRQTLSNSFYRDAFRSFHFIHVPSSEFVSLHIRPTGTTNPNNFPVTILPSARGTCNTLLPEHHPARDLVISERKEDEATHIVGGERSGQQLASYLVAILSRVPEGTGICTGTVISPTVVLTAAHCQVSTSSIVISQSTSLAAKDIRYSTNPTSVKLHPQFNLDDGFQEAFKYDIAYLTFSPGALGSPYEMKVNIDPKFPVEGSIVRSAGYGVPENGNVFSSPDDVILRQVDSVVIESQQCLRSYVVANVSWKPSNVICAGIPDKGGCGVCNGDSGGPLFQYDQDGTPVIVGVASATAGGCAHPSFPSLNIATSAFASFIPSSGVDKNPTLNTVMPSDSLVPGVREGGLSLPIILGITFGCIAVVAIAGILVWLFVSGKFT